MKKFIVLLFLCFGVFLQVKAELVPMDLNNTGYAKGYGSGTGSCDKEFKQGAQSTIGSGQSGSVFDFLAYCMANDMYDSASFDGSYQLGVPHKGEMECKNAKCIVTRVLKEGAKFYSAEVKDQTCTTVSIKGTDSSNAESRTLTRTLNSPFIYAQNSLSQNLQLTINSPLNFYQNQIPAFNINKGWQVIANRNQFVVNKTTKDYLFYELAMNKITLNRNGQNFSSQDELINYLQNSDFFTKLGLNEIQKANSLNYILPQLSQFTSANNYYLTILSDQAIQEISELSINPASKQLNRIYYAIYPTASPIKTNGELVFPQIKQTEEFTVLETGEILVKPEMFVFWE